MIRATWRKVVKFVGSPGFATWLLVVIGGYALVATLVPQIGESWGQDPKVWAAQHPVFETVAQALWLHRAFTSPIFIALVLALGVSTALCAWARTKVAVAKARTLRKAASTDAAVLAVRHDFTIACEPGLTEDEILSRAADTLEHLGVRTKRRENVIAAVSPTWSVWGSPIFHWALLVLIIALIIGNLLRAEGQMGLAVGQTKADTPEAYGILNAGVMRNWATVQRSFRLDGFEPEYMTGGINRGGTPTVALLDKDGKVVKSQRVYPNATLKSGSVSVYPKDFGLAADVSIVDSSGVELARSVQLVDFDETTESGTVSSGYLVINDAAGAPQLKVYITVPITRTNGALDKKLPATAAARVVMRALDDSVVLDQVVRQGEGIGLPVGGLVINGVGYYARLQVVDDSSIPLLYLGMVVALIGLTIAVVARQQAVLAAVVDGPDRPGLAVSVRFWRNASTNRGEIERELAQVLSAAEKGHAS